MGIPADLVQRSAAARAAADGTSVDDILTAWSGGAPAPAPPAAASVATTETPTPDPEPAPIPEPVAPPPIAVVETPPQPVAVAEQVEEVDLDPVPLRARVRTAVRIGAWTGAALGIVGFLVATAAWAPNATVLEDSGPVVQVSPTGVVVVMTLVSVVFGAIVAGMSRAATAWTNPAMQLSGSKAGTAWLGATVGLVLGAIAGAMLDGFGTAIEDADPAVVQLPVLSTLFVMVIGGAVLGAVTALVPQLLGVPVAVDALDEEEVVAVRGRLSNAVSIPIAGLLLLLVLVLPFAYALIQSNHLAPGVGGAAVAVVTAAGILGFAALSGTRPEMRISVSDVMVAVIGIGVVVTIVISVLFANRDEDHGEESADETTAIVLIL